MVFAAKLGRAHAVFWLTAMLLYYLTLAAVVIYLNQSMPLEGGLYQPVFLASFLSLGLTVLGAPRSCRDN